MVDYFQNGKNFHIIFGILLLCIISLFYLKEKLIQCVRKNHDFTRAQSIIFLSHTEGKCSLFLIRLFLFARIAATFSYILMVLFVIFAAIYWHFRISDIIAN